MMGLLFSGVKWWSDVILGDNFDAKISLRYRRDLDRDVRTIVKDKQRRIAYLDEM